MDNLDFILGRDAYYESDDFNMERQSKTYVPIHSGYHLFSCVKHMLSIYLMAGYIRIRR